MLLKLMQSLYSNSSTDVPEIKPQILLKLIHGLTQINPEMSLKLIHRYYSN